jgi:hypothetical protein
VATAVEFNRKKISYHSVVLILVGTRFLKTLYETRFLRCSVESLNFRNVSLCIGVLTVLVPFARVVWSLRFLLGGGAVVASLGVAESMSPNGATGVVMLGWAVKVVASSRESSSVM